MGNVNWTKDQQKVIDLRNRNILVSAAAGSGKTAVLVERIITMISSGNPPVDIDRLLIVTFTEAAAGEMRERIGKAIEEKLKEQPDNLHLQKQEALLHSAQITTIHSFCLSVIRNYFNTIDLDPSFRIGDETELKLLKSDVLTELLEEKYEEGSENFYRFIETYATGKSDSGIEDMILNFHNFAMSYPWPKQWMEQQRTPFIVDCFEDMESSVWMEYLMKDIGLQMESFCEEYKQLIGITKECDGPYMYTEVMEREMAALSSLNKVINCNQLVSCNSIAHNEMENDEKKSSYIELGQQLAIFKWERLSSKKDDSVNTDKRELVKEKRNQIKKELEKIKARYFYQSPEEMAEDMAKVSEVMNVLIDLAISFTDRYQEKKEERGMVDFSDLEHFALHILLKYNEETRKNEPTAVARELQDVYAEILIDEYQDSNYVQEAILTSISKVHKGEPNIFMVGDVKQSIYRFRLARPELFMEKYENYSLEDSQYQRIDLQKNFRSRAIVLRGINYIFEGIMRKELGNIAYDKAASLNPGSIFEPMHRTAQLEQLEQAEKTETLQQSERNHIKEKIDEVKKILVEQEEKEDILKTEFILVENNGEDKNLTAQEVEARAIANRIKSYVSGDMKVWDKTKKSYRNARYGDMVILLRSPKSWTDKMAEVLKEEGIPAIAHVQTGYFSALEVRTILNYLLVIDNPLQDIPLTGTLTSFIGNFTEKELGQIREGSDDETVYESLKRFVEETEELKMNRSVEHNLTSSNIVVGKSDVRSERITDDSYFEETLYLIEKIKNFLEQLSYFRQLVPYTSVYDMLQKIYAKTGFYDYVTVLPGGSVRKGNLDMLLQKAIDFEATSYGGLFHFNRYIERLHEYDIDFGEAKNADGGENVVQLMSIHKSKGLEFPIVFLAGMFKSFNKQDSKSRLVLHPDLGIGPDYVDYKLRTKTPTLLKKVIQRQLELENLGEELRVLYVALTRAKEKLVMIGSGKELEKILEKWKIDNDMSYRKLTQAGSYGDWIGPRVIRQLEETEAEQNKQITVGEQNSTDEISKEVDKRNRYRQSLYHISFVSVEHLVIEEVLEEMDRESKKEELLNWAKNHPLKEAEKKQISSYMNFVYSYKEEEKIKSKLSVSELKRMYQKEDDDLSVSLFEDPFFGEKDSIKSDFKNQSSEEALLGQVNSLKKEEAYIPDFAREEEMITGSGRGTIYHKIMEAFAFGKITGKESLKQQLDTMEATGLLLPEERKIIDMRKLTHFFYSELGRRMIEADKNGVLFKEQPFVMGVPAKEVDNTIDSEELVLVQGIVDVYFKEGDELVLVDYKTDTVNTASQLVDRYKAQLNYYKKALEQITGKKVKENRIYSFYLGKEIVVEI